VCVIARGFIEQQREKKRGVMKSELGKTINILLAERGTYPPLTVFTKDKLIILILNWKKLFEFETTTISMKNNT
jgi:hypothetical protein